MTVGYIPSADTKSHMNRLMVQNAARFWDKLHVSARGDFQLTEEVEKLLEDRTGLSDKELHSLVDKAFTDERLFNTVQILNGKASSAVGVEFKPEIIPAEYSLYGRYALHMRTQLNKTHFSVVFDNESGSQIYMSNHDNAFKGYFHYYRLSNDGLLSNTTWFHEVEHEDVLAMLDDSVAFIREYFNTHRRSNQVLLTIQCCRDLEEELERERLEEDAEEAADAAVGKFTVWWKNGTRSVIEGPSIDEAFTKAGYGSGALTAVDWYDRGDVNTHYWCVETKNWMRREPIIKP